MTSCRSSEPLKTVHSCRGHVRTVALMLKYSGVDLGLLHFPLFFLYLRFFLSVSLSFLYRIFVLSCYGSFCWLIPFETVSRLVRTSLSFLAMLRHLQKRRSVIPSEIGGLAVRPLELFSGATGVDEKLDRDCRRELLERHTFHTDSLLSVFSHQL